jgi:hypothetical protein
MPVSAVILFKIKSLLKLSSSPNEFEAKTASDMADKLIKKYNLSEEDLLELDNQKPIYSEEEKLFSTEEIVRWKNQLAIAVAKKYDCMIIQEEGTLIDGPKIYSYFVYGDPEDVGNTINIFNILLEKILTVAATNCFNKGSDYTSSYYEGMIVSIKSNLELDNIKFPKTNKKNSSDVPAVAENALVPVKQDKQNCPINEKIDISGQSLIKDVVGYFNGMSAGSKISLQDTSMLDYNVEINNLLLQVDDIIDS